MRVVGAFDLPISFKLKFILTFQQIFLNFLNKFCSRYRQICISGKVLEYGWTWIHTIWMNFKLQNIKNETGICYLLIFHSSNRYQN